MDDDLRPRASPASPTRSPRPTASAGSTVTHDLDGAPNLAVMTSGQADDQRRGGGGWPWVLSDLKSLLETGTAFSRPN